MDERGGKRARERRERGGGVVRWGGGTHVNVFGEEPLFPGVFPFHLKPREAFQESARNFRRRQNGHARLSLRAQQMSV